MAREIIRSSDGAEKKPVTRAAEEAVKEEPKKEPQVPAKDRKSKALPYRIFAWVLWILAIGFEVLTILVLTKCLSFGPKVSIWIPIVIGIVLDMACAIAAAQLWKKANHINPPSKKNKFLFYLISELGVIMACICFIPLIVMLIKNKELDKKTKIIVTIVAIVALLITSVASADFDPISKEELDAAEEVITDEVYWTAFGRKYHTEEDCQAIKNPQPLYAGTVTEAVEAGRGSLCAFCAARHPEYAEAGVKTEDGTAAELKDLEIITTTLPVVTTVGGE